MIRVTRQPFDPGVSGWRAILPPAEPMPAVSGPMTVDFLVIGAGFAGLAAARRLHQLAPDAKIALVEARSIAEGPAGRNSGFMIDIPHRLGSANYAGQLEEDRQHTALNREAIQYAAEAADEYGMSDEAFAKSGKINAAATAKGDAHNRSHARHLKDMGEAHELLDGDAMRAICGSDYYRGGLFSPNAAMIQPALFVRNVAAGLARAGVGIYEQSPVGSLVRDGDGWSADCGDGKIAAGTVILAVNGHVESFGFFKRRLMHIYLYASMTRALTSDEVKRLGGEPRWGFTPSDPIGTTVRRISGTGGDRIVVRNKLTWAPSRTVSPDRVGRMGQSHDAAFRARFPQLADVTMEYRWGGLLCLSRNDVPAFGELDQNLYSACCQNGLGTAQGTLSGKLAAELALGHKSDSLDRFLALDQPTKVPPEPFATVGAMAVTRWKEMRAGSDL